MIFDIYVPVYTVHSKLITRKWFYVFVKMQSEKLYTDYLCISFFSIDNAHNIDQSDGRGWFREYKSS